MVDDTDTTNKDKHRHFKAHSTAVVDATKAIATTNAKLKKTNKLDEREALQQTMDTHVTTLTQAVTAAVQDPPPPPKENTGGAAQDPVVDPHPEVE